MSEHHSVIIIGAGLSGLYAAWQLHQQQQDVIVLEARNRCGGRILSHGLEAEGDTESSHGCDLGPAWVWPQFQPRLASLLKHLNITLFKQYTQGDILYEGGPNAIERYSDQSAHNQSYRIRGGADKLIEALQANLPKEILHLNTRVQTLQQQPLSIETLRDGKVYNYSADNIILALPPRVALQTIEFNPALADVVTHYWQTVPTWMAGHCKIIFMYKKPFWRQQNLSGEVFSRQGPLTEIYDGSPDDESYYALTSFVGITPEQRSQITTAQLTEQCQLQLQRLFGDDALNVTTIKVQDWSQEEYTTTPADLTSPAHHPEYSESLPRHLWNKKLLLAGTEVAREHGGYLEGALVSADEALTNLKPG